MEAVSDSTGARQPATSGRDIDTEHSQQWERPTKSGRLASQIGRDELESHFHTPVDVAATNMGVGLTKLKAICRSLNISRCVWVDCLYGPHCRAAYHHRWPYRRIRRLQYLAHRVMVRLAHM